MAFRGNPTRTPRRALTGMLALSWGLWMLSPLPALADQEEVEDELVEAIEDDEDDIYFIGKESDPVVIKKGVIVTGKNRAESTINDDVVMEDGAVLRNVTINAKVFGITVKKGATVLIENVSIKGATDTGVFSEKGGGTLTIRNSLISKNRKGFYILPGKNVVITGNQVTENSEEGIDIRNDVDGVISGNTVRNNGEGGGEIIVGDSTLTVTGNTFTQNGSSGLALQFYPDNEPGKMQVRNNTFSQNRNYGVVCNAPSGGDKPKDFFFNSIDLYENVISGNRKGALSGCGILRNIVAGVAEEEPEAEEVEPLPPPLPFEEEPSRIKEVRLEEITGEVLSVEPQIKRERTRWENWRHYWFRTDEWYFATQEENLHRLQEKLLAAQALPDSEGYPEIKALFPEKIDFIEDKIAELSALLEAQRDWVPVGFLSPRD